MHRNSYEEMRAFARMLPPSPLRIADIGSKDESGGYRPLFQREGWTYVRMDFSTGPDVDAVLPEQCGWTNLKDGEFDVVVSGRLLEHVRFPWLFVQEAARIVKPGGWVCIVAPYQWEHHARPIDCWRVYPDGMRAVMEHAGLVVLSAHLSDSGDPNRRGDTVGVARKPYVSRSRSCLCPEPKAAGHRVEAVGGREFPCCPGSRMRRNLSYFVYPLRGSIWAWNVDQIRPFLPVFNGRKIVSVAEDGMTEPFMAVADRFGDPSITYIRARNDPSKREMVTFLEALGRVRSLDPGEMTFYAHAKGVSHWSRSVSNVMAWTRAMYLLNLCDVGAVERVMESHGAVGAFREGHPVWHYSGTFFWLKHSEIFSTEWDRHESGVLGPETYPGTHLPFERSFDLTLGRYYPDRYNNLFPEAEIRSALDEVLDAVQGGAGRPG